MPASPLRYKRLLSEIPKHKTAQGALLASGFTRNTATKQSKSVLRSAVRHQAREILNASPNMTATSKQLMHDILGISSNDLFNRLKWLALENDKDAGTALKILAPLVREHGVILSTEDDQTKVIVPVINLGFSADNMAKNIEPVIEHEKIESKELDNGLVEP